MTDILIQLSQLRPEMALFAGAILSIFFGLSHKLETRQIAWIPAVASCVIAMLIAGSISFDDQLLSGRCIQFCKMMLAAAGAISALSMTGMLEALPINLLRKKRLADPQHIYHGEGYAFMLAALAGAMLCVQAHDLIWLALSLELLSLPCYVLIAVSSNKLRAQEAALKYFFLGAMAAAIFLLGFTFIYGATGLVNLSDIRDYNALHGVSPLMATGVMLAILGITFKISAVPLHFYVADVYEGASAPVSGFLSIVPKTAGFLAIFSLLMLVSWLPQGDKGLGEMLPLFKVTLSVIAVLTMTIGNVLALLQSSIKRLLAYSSVAQSGYMILALIAGPSIVGVKSSDPTNGIGALLFYLVVYGAASLTCFTILSLFQDTRRGREIETLKDLGGLSKQHPVYAALLMISAMSLMGLPFLGGFSGKIHLIYATLNIGQTGTWLVIALLVNSAISVAYYIRLAARPYTHSAPHELIMRDVPARRIAIGIASTITLACGGFLGSHIVQYADQAGALPRSATIMKPTTCETTTDTNCTPENNKSPIPHDTL